MEYTQNYQLCQWAEEDRIRRADFNGDNAKIDGALAAQQRAINTQAAALAKCGNCRIYTTSYVGSGNYGETPNSITFPGTPMVVMVSGTDRNGMIAIRGGRMAIHSNATLTWSGSTLSWSATNAAAQVNVSGISYQVLALLVAG